MPPLINSIVIACLALCSILALAELIHAHSLRRFLLEAGLLVAATVVLYATTDFPRPKMTQLFGPATNPLPMVVLLFLCIVLGMACRYIFYLRRPFDWRSFLKPLCVSPIVLLPLLGTLQNTTPLEPIQAISFSLLAFQSGFFWRAVFERTQPDMRV